MKTQLAVMMALFAGILSAQVELNYSYEMKYGDGKEVYDKSPNEIDPPHDDYNYIENLIEINTTFSNGVYLFTQLEYSNPPVFGYNRTQIDSLLSRFYFEYFLVNYMILGSTPPYMRWFIYLLQHQLSYISTMEVLAPVSPRGTCLHNAQNQHESLVEI